MAKVVNIVSGITDKQINPDVILENLKCTLDGFVYAGYNKDGDFVCGSTYPDGPNALWLLELTKRKLLGIGSDE